MTNLTNLFKCGGEVFSLQYLKDKIREEGLQAQAYHSVTGEEDEVSEFPVRLCVSRKKGGIIVFERNGDCYFVIKRVDMPQANEEAVSSRPRGSES